MNGPIIAIIQRNIRVYFPLIVILSSIISFPSLVLILTLLGVDKLIKLNLGTTYSLFLIPGLICLTILNHSSLVGIGLINDKKRSYQLLKVLPISRLSIILGTFLGVIIMEIIGVIPLIILISVLSGKLALINYLLVLFYIVLLSIGFFGFFFSLSIFLKRGIIFSRISSTIILLFTFVSGVFYSISKLPPLLKFIALLNPITYGADAIRYSLLGVHEINLVFSLIVLVLFSAITLLITLYLFNSKWAR